MPGWCLAKQSLFSAQPCIVFLVKVNHREPQFHISPIESLTNQDVGQQVRRLPRAQVEEGEFAHAVPEEQQVRPGLGQARYGLVLRQHPGDKLLPQPKAFYQHKRLPLKFNKVRTSGERLLGE